MPASACSDPEFINLFRQLGPTRMAKKLGVSERRIYARRRSIERATGKELK